jgi:hypothetical protein
LRYIDKTVKNEYKTKANEYISTFTIMSGITIISIIADIITPKGFKLDDNKYVKNWEQLLQEFKTEEYIKDYITFIVRNSDIAKYRSCKR